MTTDATIDPGGGAPAPVDPPPPDAASPPSAAAKAAAKLAELQADKDWAARLLKGDDKATKEFHELSRAAAESDAGDVVLRSASEIVAAQTADMLREMGLSDAVVEEWNAGKPVAAKDKEAAEAWMVRHQRDQGWVKRVMQGDVEAGRQLMLHSIIMAAPTKEKTK